MSGLSKPVCLPFKGVEYESRVLEREGSRIAYTVAVLLDAEGERFTFEPSIEEILAGENDAMVAHRVERFVEEVKESQSRLQAVVGSSVKPRPARGKALVSLLVFIATLSWAVYVFAPMLTGSDDAEATALVPPASAPAAPPAPTPTLEERRAEVRRQAVELAEAMYYFHNVLARDPEGWKDLAAETGLSQKTQNSVQLGYGGDRTYNLPNGQFDFRARSVWAYDMHRPQDRCMADVVNRPNRVPRWQVEYLQCSWEDPMIQKLRTGPVSEAAAVPSTTP